jgi:tetratricopeptide (TPR) repeat protein
MVFAINNGARGLGMEENLDGRRGIREYLLGILEDPSIKGQIEEKLLADDGEISTAEDELIEQYLDDELSPADRKHFINHFLAAPQRQQQLRVHQKLRKYAAAQAPARAVSEAPSHLGWQRFFSMPALRYAMGFIVVVGLGYGGWRIGFDRSNDVEMAMAELKSDRPFNSRIVGSDYAPVVNTRGPDPDKDPNTDRKRRAVLILQKAVADNRTAESLHRLGKAYLVEGDLPAAIRFLEEAAALGPVNAGLMSDLGAAYLEAWRKEGAAGKTEMLDKSLQSLDRSVELDPKLQEPRFNRALVLEAKGSREQAKQAWREYLELDPNSKWAEEARRNLVRLEENQ